MRHLFLLLSLFAVSVSYAYDFRKSVQGGNTLWFNIVDNKNQFVVVSSPDSNEIAGGNYSAPHGVLTIPATVNYDGTLYTVVGVERNAFASSQQITSVSLPPSISFLGEWAFRNCPNLRSVYINCDSLSESYSAFENCPALDTVVIGKDVRILPPYLFSNVKNIKYIDFLAEHPVSMRNIFYACLSPAVLSIGEAVPIVPPYLCCNFMGLRSFVVRGESPALSEIGECAFLNCFSVGEIVIPSSVTMLSGGSLAHCQPRTITFLSRRPPIVLSGALAGIDGQTMVYIPCLSRGFYANSPVGRTFMNLVYLDSCLDVKVETEIVYIHDTVLVFDTIFLPIISALNEEDDVSEENQFYIPENDFQSVLLENLILTDNVLCLDNADSYAGSLMMFFDVNGRLVFEKDVPVNQVSDKYCLTMPEYKRYFLRFISSDGKNVFTIALDLFSSQIH